jgi:ABC-2 type transport system ATP-binding protein
MLDHAPHDTAIELTGVTKRFGDQVAVDNLSLRIPTGTTFGFIGPNGAGKSTTIKMIMGLQPIDAGQVRVLDVDVRTDRQAVAPRVGYVPEQQFIYRWMTVGEVVGFCRSFYETWNDDLCGHLVDQFELPRQKKVKHLSKGMGAKLSLVLALSHEPAVLILDEPTSGLDPIVREEFLDGVLQSVCWRGQTVLFSSHTLSDVQRLADTVGLIHCGKLLTHCTVDDLLNGTKRIRATLQDGHLPEWRPDGTICERLQRREWVLTVTNYTPELVDAVRSSNPVQHVDVVDLGLEDIFKDYVKGRRAMA